MAGTKIRGITIELGADTSGLSKALKGVNTEIKSTQKQLKDVERLLKLDPTNTELLEQKQRLLGQSVEQTKSKLTALKEAQKQVSEELEKTGKGQEQYDALTREIAATERELKEAETAARSFNAATQKIAASAGKVAQKFGTVAQKTKAFSMAAGGVLASMGALVAKTAQEADELNTLSKQTGVSTEELQKMRYAADLIDVDTDTIVGGMKKLKKQLENTNAPFAELGVNVKDANGEFRDITDIFYDTVAALSKIPNETERDIIAMELFGKSADELAGVIDDGGAALKRLGEEAENLGVIIPQEDIDKANELNDALDQFKAQSAGVFAEIGTELAEMLLPYLPDLKEFLSECLQYLKDMDKEDLAFIAKLAGAAALLSPVASVLSAIASSVSLIAGLGGKIAAFLATAEGGFVAVGAAITSFIALIGGNIYLFATYLDEMKGGIDAAKETIDLFFQNLCDRTTESLGFTLTGFNEWVTNVGSVLNGFIDMASGLFQTLAGLITGNWSSMWEGMKLTLMGFCDAALSALRGLANTVIGTVNDIISAINKVPGLNYSTIPLFDDTASIVDEYNALNKKPEIVIKDGKVVKYGFAEGGTISNGSALVGEQGPEILTVANGAATVTPLDGAGGSTDIIGLLATYLPYLASGNTIVMDSGALVGSIAPDMNAALGTIAIRGGKR